MSDPTDELFRLLADPTRRRILDLIVEHESLTVTEIATQFPDLVASGISKHLMTLRASGLVLAERRGRHQHYRVDGDALARAIEPWASRYRAYWGRALESLRELSESDE